MKGSDSDWVPSGDEDRAMLVPSSVSDDESNYMSGSSSSIDDSDLDTFIMSTAQSAVLTRRDRRRKKPKDGLVTDDVMVETKSKKKKKKTLATPNNRLSPEVKEILGRGHNAFLKRDYDSAIQLLEETVRLAPGIPDPFVTLGAIYEELNDPKRAIEALLVAVHLTPADAELWKRVASMSQTIGNLDQSIYCYRRSIKAATSSTEAEQYQTDLAHVLVRAQKYSEAVVLLRKIFHNATGDDAVSLGSLLAKSLYHINQKTEAMAVLESLMEPRKQTTLDANIINMLSEVYIDTREYGRCFTLLTSVLDMDNLDNPEKCPVDLVAKLAISIIPSFDRHRAVCAKAVACIRALPVEGYSDLYFSVADSFIANKRPHEALQLLLPAHTLLLSDVTRTRMGKCKYLLGDYEGAAEFLAGNTGKADIDALVMWSDSLRNLGREEEAAQLLKHLQYEDLIAAQTLPAALPTTQRRRMLEQLRNLLQEYPDIGSRETTGLGGIRVRFANMFIELLKDCELDNQRVERYRAQRGDVDMVDWDGTGAVAMGGHHVTVPAFKVRQNLDLENAEDVLGTERFVEFVIAGSAVCAAAERHKDCVELIEVLLQNKRKKWGQREDGQAHIGSLERLSFSLSMEAGLTRVANKYLRQEIVEVLDSSPDDPERGDKLERAVSIMTRLMFDGTNKFVQREMLDQRSWLIRQAIRYPLEFSLCMLCGHICVYASNSRFASQEYLRAHRLRPTDPWPLLCLGVSLATMAMSRTSQERQFTVLKSFAVLQEYARLRRVSGNDPAEIHYNFGRMYHQLGLWSQADHEYREVLRITPAEAREYTVVRQSAAYNLSLIRLRNGLSKQASQILMSNIVAN